jgi:hypothetical protein
VTVAETGVVVAAAHAETVVAVVAEEEANVSEKRGSCGGINGDGGERLASVAAPTTANGNGNGDQNRVSGGSSGCCGYGCGRLHQKLRGQAAIKKMQQR